MDRATQGEKILLGSAAALLVLSILKMWAKVDFGDFGDLGVNGNLNAWDAYNFFPLKLGLMTALAAVVVVGVRVFGNVEIPPVAHAALGGVTLLMVLLAVLTGPAGSGIDAFGAGIDRGLMLFIAIIPAAGAAYGGYLHMQEAGGTTPSFGGGPAAPPPPPA